MQSDKAALDFAYRYPFSNEAREIIAGASQGLDERLVRAGRERVEQDLNSESFSYSSISMPEIKMAYVLSYVYSRMIISAIGNRMHLERYIVSEARRAGSALERDSMPNLLRLLGELGMEMSYSQERFIIGFAKFLKLSSRSAELSLAKQELEKGLVYLSKDNTIRLMENAIAEEIRKKLPIPQSELPKRIIEEAKGVRLPKLDIRVEVREGSYKWIEKILSNPIGDVRHRTVNLILAPYLVNIKGMDEEKAAEVIMDFIERCKQINPDTRVNSSYIKYQCRYAKLKGLKPLSLDKARELYRGVLDLE
jgi:hypothetical protein